MAKSRYWINFNFNPFKQNIGDCVIRAVSGATGLSYKEVCKRFGVSWKTGCGLIRANGLPLDKIEQTFDEYFDVVEDYYDNFEFIPDEMKNDPSLDDDIAVSDNWASGLTLNDFCQLYSGQGLFLVSLHPNPKAENPDARDMHHIVFANLSKRGKPRFFDTWDSGEMFVDAYMRVKKREPKDSPLHWKYDYENHRFIV